MKAVSYYRMASMFHEFILIESFFFIYICGFYTLYTLYLPAATCELFFLLSMYKILCIYIIWSMLIEFPAWLFKNVGFNVSYNIICILFVFRIIQACCIFRQIIIEVWATIEFCQMVYYIKVYLYLHTAFYVVELHQRQIFTRKLKRPLKTNLYRNIVNRKLYSMN